MNEYIEIVSKALENDRHSQKKIYDLLSPKLYAVCLRYTRTRAEAQDLLQDAFLKIFSKLTEFKQEGSFEGWARRITVNVILDSFRRKKLLEYSLEYNEHGNQFKDYGVNIVDELSYEDLLAIVAKLPEGKRVVFNLFVIEGYSHKEIAEMLGINEGTSKSQLGRAKEALAEMLLLLNKNAG